MAEYYNKQTEDESSNAKTKHFCRRFVTPYNRLLEIKQVK